MPRSLQIGISLTAFADPEAVKDFIGRAEERGIDPLFELSYSSDRNFLEAVSFLKGRVVSVHAPCPRQEFFPNLGSRDQAVVEESLRAIRESARTAARFGASHLVLHPGYTFDQPVHLDARVRLRFLESHLQEKKRWIWIEQGAICRPEYCQSEQYRLHLDQAFVNLERAAELCRKEGVRLCAENMNPRVSYLFQTPEDLLPLGDAIPHISLCIDLGHLWLSSLVHGFDYLGAIERLARSGRVAATHIHDNRSTLEGSAFLADEHLSIGSGVIPLAAAIRLLIDQTQTTLMAETIHAPLANLETLIDMAGGVSP